MGYNELIPIESSFLELARRRLDQTLLEDEIRTGEKADEAQCKVCAALIKLATASIQFNLSVSLGNWNDLKRISCTVHTPIFLHCGDLESQDVRISKPAGQKLLYVFPQTGHSSIRSALEAPWEPFVPLQELNSSGVTEESEQLRFVNSAWIDINLCKDWLFECQRNHHDTCDIIDLELQSTNGPLLLVDTKDHCIVPGTVSSRYCALSYVWGGMDSSITKRISLEQMAQPGILLTSSLELKLPRTIRQAIILSQALGLRYLWVDALCIAQDLHEKSLQLNDMASIFANATLTIVAAEGTNADSGFSGLSGISKERSITQEKVELLPHLHLVKPSSRQVWDNSLLKPWSERAWTFVSKSC